MFEIQNYNDHGVDLSYNDCVKNIEREIDNCGRGGQETFNGIRYRYAISLCFIIGSCRC